MIPEIISLWDKYKENLRKSFESEQPEDYKRLIQMIARDVLNAEKEIYDIEDITEVLPPHYSGTLILVMHKNKCEPDVSDYIYTSIWYGSCSHCDAIEYAKYYCDNKADGYMQLALHIIQKFRRMGE